MSRFALSDMIECGTVLRKLGTTCQNMEEVATSIVRFIHSSFIDPESGRPACALVRYFKTHPYAELGAELEKFADHALGGKSAVSTTRCLTLLATAGDLPEWNDRRRSSGHRAIPLASEKMVEQAPMIARLIQQFGLDISTVITPERAPLMVLEQKTYNVFHVQDARGSPYVPAQEDFVVPHKIKSVLGFGGLFPNGDLFAVILFSKVSIPKETADMFSTLALGVKLAVLPFVRGPIFSLAAGGSH